MTSTKRHEKAPIRYRGFWVFRKSYWRLAPFRFTGWGWKLRSSSQRWTWCFEKRTLSIAARRKIAAAQRARWAKVRQQKKAA